MKIKKTTKIYSENRKKLHTNDPIKWIVDDYGSLILKRNKETLTITTSKTGINTSYEDRYYINHIDITSSSFPGEIPLDRFITFLSNKINVPFYSQKPSDIKVFEKPIELVEYALREQKLTILTALRQSKIWEKRGFSEQEKRAPKEYWKIIPFDIIDRYNGNEGPKIMWKNMLLSQSFGKDIDKDKQTEGNIIDDAIFQKAIELKIVPEVPWGIRKWSNFELENLTEYIHAGTTRSKHWANYATTCFMFDKTMRNHNVLNQRFREGSPLQKKRDEFMEFIYKWPKTKAGIGSIEEAFNQGMNMINILDLQPKNPKELLDCIQVWRQMGEKNRLHLNETYEVPKNPLKDGYKYVDHTDALQISDDYSCCFSNSPEYIDAICRGEGFAIYRPHFKGSDKGSLCFFELEKSLKTQERIWVINEHRGYGNSNPDKQYIQDMKVILRTINVTHPYPFPIVQQDNERVIKDLIETNPKFEKVVETVKKYSQQIWEEINKNCAFEYLEDAISQAGCSLDRKTYEWKPNTETYEKKIVMYNNITQRLIDDGNKLKLLRKDLLKSMINMRAN